MRSIAKEKGGINTPFSESAMGTKKGGGQHCIIFLNALKRGSQNKTMEPAC